MKQKLDDVAADANRAAYDAGVDDLPAEASPHLRHASLRRLFRALARDVVARAQALSPQPTVLDVGAGDGSVTRTFLELGANVTAVDVSEQQLDALMRRNAMFAGQVVAQRGEAAQTVARLADEGRRFDIVAAVSFLHHVPDYLSLVRALLDVLEPHGQILVFQDPMAHSTVRPRDHKLARIAYLSWRLRQPDVRGGLGRHLRRRRGIWLDDCAADNVEYHELRSGVEQDAIRALLEQHGLEVDVRGYFSTQSPFWQRIGERLGARNQFALVARRS